MIPQGTKDKIDALIKFLADATLPITNRNTSRKLKGFDNLYELKPKNVRIFYFQYGKDFIIASGCKKGNKKENQQDMKKADNLRRQFLSED